MTVRMMSVLTVATMLTILVPPGLCAARFKVWRAVAPNPPVTLAADAA